ncbi:MAG: hypothetical protein A07HN63_01462 [uncultured archaeon A07HN63]|nr:MAG: hypothetical protein A07HN63_01462 [uncultured archaeon A07HN63]
MAAVVGTNVLRELVGPLGVDALADAFDTSVLVIRLGSVAVATQQDVLREIDIEAVDGIEPQRDIAVDPDLSDRDGHRVGLDRLDQPLDAVEGGRPVECRLGTHTKV